MSNFYSPEGHLLETQENFEYISSLSGLEYAMSAGIILESRAALCDEHHNLTVELGEYKGIIPKEEAVFSPSGEPIRDIAVITRVGKPVCFKVVSIDKSALPYRIILSRRLAQKECYDNHVSRLCPGDIIDAKVTHTEPFGVFCDIGCGLVSLLPVDCISVSRISHPKERFFNGQYIKCIIKSCDAQSGRIMLTHKELLGTWQENASLFSAGQTAAGIVRSIEPYGIFVELAPNLAGLAECCEDDLAGQSAAVYIKSIIPEKMKIKLVIVDLSSRHISPKAPEYFYTGSSITRWEYSPPECDKNIFTDFTQL